MLLDVAKLDNGRKDVLQDEVEKKYFVNIKQFLIDEKKSGKIIYPEEQNIFSAFYFTPFNDVKVVVIGQDPYHGVGQSHGLCFSVQKGIKVPPSLRNIYKELHDDIDFIIPNHGCLQSRAEQGVFLLNAILTVEAHKPTSHASIGWQQFTDHVIKSLSDKQTGLVFLLRGAFAQSKKKLIDLSKHYILETTHPSPFSAYRGFLGSKQFSKTNEILYNQNKDEIDRSIV